MRTSIQRFAVAIGVGLLAPFACASGSGTSPTGGPDPWTVDFRYAPPAWQTAICLPDDWQKTLVAKDGGLLYDYPGRYSGFGTKITAGALGETKWVKQELDASRVPIVRTTKATGTAVIVEEAFAVAPRLAAAKQPLGKRPFVRRLGAATGATRWAAPRQPCDPAFRNAAIGWAQAVRYRFPARAGERHTVIFGLCEGYHPTPGQRILNLELEGRTRRTVDIVAERGRNVPALYAFEALDENGDGAIEVAVVAADNSPDKNTILNVLWVFRAGEAPPLAELLAGQSATPPLAHEDCGAETTGGGPPRHEVLILRLRNHRALEAQVTPTLTLESEAIITPDPAQRQVKIGAQTTVFCPQGWEQMTADGGRVVLQFPAVTIPADSERVLAFGVGRGTGAVPFPRDVPGAEAARKRAERYWAGLDLPYEHLEVPDRGIQALLDSAIRNIYQAREIKNGLPAFQVGPTCYRGL